MFFGFMVSDGVNIVSPKLQSVMLGSQGVEFSVGCQCQQVPDTDQVKMPLGVLRDGISPIGGQTLQFRFFDVLPVLVGKQYAKTVLIQ